jgi:small subunit ribosomal protein S17
MPDENKTDETTEPEAVEQPEAEATGVPEAAATEEPEPEAAAEADAPEPAAEAEAEVAGPAPAEEPAAEETAADEAEAEPPAAEAEPEPEPTPAPEATPAPEPKKARKRLPRALRHKHSKPTRERPAARKPIVHTPKPESSPGRRQERRGVVVSDKADKTIVVSVDVTKIHPKYKKVVRRSRKFHVHDEQNAAGIGDVVRIVETRPLSKTKNWRLAEIVEKAK